jgi:anti-sigma28 factor (negative regulator of flagellin synthesis)
LLSLKEPNVRWSQDHAKENARDARSESAERDVLEHVEKRKINVKRVKKIKEHTGCYKLLKSRVKDSLIGSSL